MGHSHRSVYIALTILFLVVVDSSDTFFFLNRKLIGASNKNDTATQVSQLPSPVSDGKELNKSKVDADKPGKDKTKDSQVTANSSNVDPKSLKSKDNKTNISSTNSHNGHTVNAADSKQGTGESCNGYTRICNDKKSMTACLQKISSGSKEVVVLIQNKGDSTLMVNVAIEPLKQMALPATEVPKHHSTTVNASVEMGTSAKIILNAGHGECILDLNPPVSERNFIEQLSFYSKQVTPVYGAFFLLLVTISLGGTWACFKLRKRKRQGEIPYQELEMGLPESASTGNVDTAEGWDQGWDDDWDEENAVKSPGGRHVAGVSANGLTARSSRRDGWEKDWDD